MPVTGPEPDDLTTLHVQRARTGDGASLEWIVTRFTPLLLAQARYRLGPTLAAHADPEDVVQDVWATALPRLAGLGLRDGRATPVLLRFLCTTLLHRVNNLLRRAATAAASATPTGAGTSAVPADTPGPRTRAIAHEGARLVLAAIDELGERDRELVVLRGIEQNDVADVASALGLSPNATAQAYRRALARLRERLPDSVFAELD